MIEGSELSQNYLKTLNSRFTITGDDFHFAFPAPGGDRYTARVVSRVVRLILAIGGIATTDKRPILSI